LISTETRHQLPKRSGFVSIEAFLINKDKTISDIRLRLIYIVAPLPEPSQLQGNMSAAII
jgi:hypothetical protein